MNSSARIVRMANSEPNLLAAEIIRELETTGYYKEPEVLSHFLRTHVRGGEREALQLATAITSNFRRFGCYSSQSMLAGLLEGRLHSATSHGGAGKREARKVAGTIIKDLNGPAFYADVTILAGFLASGVEQNVAAEAVAAAILDEHRLSPALLGVESVAQLLRAELGMS